MKCSSDKMDRRVVFSNVQIALSAADPSDAYNKLCELLERGCKEYALEYTTDTSEVVEPPEAAPWPTSGDTVLLLRNTKPTGL